MSMPWVPEIMYEDDEEGGLTSHIPFIQVPDDEDMPSMLFISECRDSGEFEPGPDGEDLPIIDLTLHQYAEMEILKKNLPPDVYDMVRAALGLIPMKEAVVKGREITQRVRDNVTK